MAAGNPDRRPLLTRLLDRLFRVRSLSRRSRRSQFIRQLSA